MTINSPGVTVRGWIVLGVLALLTFRLLAIFIIAPIGDEVALLYMADDFAHLKNFRAYFYHQDVLGPLEAYFIAPFYRFFGFSFWAGRFYNNLFFFLPLVGMFLWVVRRLFDRELTAYLFVLLSVLPFPALFLTTMVQRVPMLTLALLSLVLLLKLAEGQGKFSWKSLSCGFVSGLAFWFHPISVVWLVPIGISLLWLIPTGERMKLLFRFALGFLAGLFPVWIHGIRTGVLMSAEGHGGSGFTGPGEVLQMAYLFFVRAKYYLSTFSYGNVSSLVDQLVRWLSLIPFVLFSASFAALSFHFCRTLRRQQLEEKIFFLFMILPPLILMPLYCSRNLIEDESARFLMPLTVTYVFSVSWWVKSIKSVLLKQGILAVLISVLLLGNFFSGVQELKRTLGFRKLVQFLEEKDLRAGVADIWTAYTINMLSNHRIVASPLPHHAMVEPVWQEVKERGPQFLIVDRASPRLRQRLEADQNLRRESIAGYDIFYGYSPFLEYLLNFRQPLPI